MAFPEEPLGLRGELRVGQSWTDITADLKARDRITHTRGRSYRSHTADPASCTATLKNLDGKYSPRNPLSPYFEQIGRNTPFRITLPGPDTYLAVNSGRASTPDAAPLDITGDLDVRVDVTLDNWKAGTTNTELAGKYVISGNQRSWLFMVDQLGRLVFRWSADGTAIIQQFSDTPVTPSTSGRLTVRATIDVNDGAGNNVVTLYQGPSMTGPWTTLDTFTTAGVTSIFNSTAAVDVGDVSGVGFLTPAGHFHAFQLRSGINGSIVANPDFTVQTVGAASFVDSAGRTWTLAGDADLDNHITRCSLEVPEWPPKWAPSEQDAWTPIQAAGILRRLGQGAKALDSTLRRRIPSFQPLAYWPLEDGANSTQAFSPIAGVRPLALSRANWAQADSLPSSNPLPVLASSGTDLPMMQGRIPTPATTLTSWAVRYIYRLDTVNATTRTFMRILSTGTVAEWLIQQSGTGSDVIGKDADGATVFTQGIATGTNIYNDWISVRFTATQVGGNVTWAITWFNIGGTGGAFTDTFAGTVGRPTWVASPSNGYSSDLDGMALGHISAWSTDTTAAYSGAIDAWTGETAGERMQRLCEEEGVPLTIVGDLADTELVGPQRPDTLLELLSQAAAVDGGIFGEQRDPLGLMYRTRASLYNQDPKLTLNYAAQEVAPPFEPVEDDQVRNDWEVQREGGSSGRAVLEEGALSVQDPPDGIGLYRDSVTLNLHSDGQTDSIAGWRLHLSSHDEARYPQVTVRLHKHPELIPDVLDLDVGDKIRITNLPKWVAPGDVDLLVDGWSETFHPRLWEITFNCSPAGPYTVGVYDADHYDTDGSELVAAVDTDDTLLSVRTTSGPRWTTEAVDMPVDVTVGGETMTVTQIRPGVVDTFTRTTSSSWGTADTGQAWTLTGGAAADHFTQGAEAAHRLTNVDVARVDLLTVGSSDCDLRVDIATGALATGGPQLVAVAGRATDGDNLYMAQLTINTSGSIVLTLRKRVAGVETQLATYTTSLTHAAFTFYRVRLQAVGTLVQARVWVASGTEPSVWQVSVTDTSLSGGVLGGCRSVRQTANTNANLVASWDNFQVLNPQAMTVTRSVNGVVKSHGAGTSVGLVQPAVRAL